jgi:hypothetical protein
LERLAHILDFLPLPSAPLRKSPLALAKRLDAYSMDCKKVPFTPNGGQYLQHNGQRLVSGSYHVDINSNFLY